MPSNITNFGFPQVHYIYIYIYVCVVFWLVTLMTIAVMILVMIFRKKENSVTPIGEVVEMGSSMEQKSSEASEGKIERLKHRKLIVPLIVHKDSMSGNLHSEQRSSLPGTPDYVDDDKFFNEEGMRDGMVGGEDLLTNRSSMRFLKPDHSSSIISVSSSDIHDECLPQTSKIVDTPESIESLDQWLLPIEGAQGNKGNINRISTTESRIKEPKDNNSEGLRSHKTVPLSYFGSAAMVEDGELEFPREIEGSEMSANPITDRTNDEANSEGQIIRDVCSVPTDMSPHKAHKEEPKNTAPNTFSLGENKKESSLPVVILDKNIEENLEVIDLPRQKSGKIKLPPLSFRPSPVIQDVLEDESKGDSPKTPILIRADTIKKNSSFYPVLYVILYIYIYIYYRNHMCFSPLWLPINHP